MSNKARRMLVLLLILLKEAGSTAACSSSCSSVCDCSSRGLTSVPQDLPTDITGLDLGRNAITTLSQSDFSRYRSLTTLDLSYNQISIIHNKTFHNLTYLTRLDLNDNRLTNLTAGMFVGLGNLQYLWLQDNRLTRLPAYTFVGLDNLWRLSLASNQITRLSADTFAGLGSLQVLYLNRNQLTSLPADIFAGLGTLQELNLPYNKLTRLPADILAGLGNLDWLRLNKNNIQTIEAGTFNDTTKLRILQLHHNNISTITADTFGNLLQLQTLRISHNIINTFPVEALLSLNISALSELTLDNNQLETLPLVAYDILASISNVNIGNNPWQCDCRMVPFKQRIGPLRPFENKTKCAGPANLTGQLLVYVNPEDLICENTTPVYSTFSTFKHMVDSTDPPFTFQSTMTMTMKESNTDPAAGGILLSVPLLATLGAILGLLLLCTIGLAVGCMYKRRQRDPTPLQGFSNTNPTGTSSGHDQIGLQAVATNDINSQSETPHLGRHDSLHIYSVPKDDSPDLSEYASISENTQSESPNQGNRQSLDSFGYLNLTNSLPPENQPGSGQIQQHGSFNDDYEVPSPSLYPGEGPQSYKYVNSQVAAAAKDAATGPQDVVYENGDETAAGPQIDEELVDNQSQTAAAPGADSPHHYEPLRNPSSQQQHTYTSLMPHGLQCQ